MSGINPDQTLLSLKNVSVIRRGERILDKVSLTVQGGEIVTLIGPNGSGKSTLVKTALGLIKPDSGQIIRSPLYSMAYVPQSIDIDETLPITVQRFFRLHSRAARATYIAALEQTGAAHLIDTSMHHLSGGEMRRVLLARAIVRKPALLILDEPTAGVDIGGQAALYALIQDLRGRGLFIGIEIDPSMATARAICEALMARGLLSKETHSTVVRLAPPLIISKTEIDWAVTQIREVLQEIDRVRLAS